ncbi:MAG TPA: diguanylate cyclase [Burkholderiales bacterium]|nr:diguanylate cyclase [Burkholderiales bacterium]
MSDGHARPTRTSKAMWRAELAVVISFITLLVVTPTVWAADTSSGDAIPVRLQLKWRHQFQFAGFYTALEKGYYREAGFAVTIIPATPGTDPVEAVLKGGADFGVASSELVLRYAKGDPVVVLASIFQHSPLTLFVRRDAGINTVRDLAGRKVALASWETEIFAYLQREQVPVDRLQLVQHDYSVDTLVRGRVDALAGYETDESYYLQQSGGRYSQFTPRSSGVDFYGDTLFTTRAMVARHPQWVEAFRTASLRGWGYALAHQEEISAIIHAKYAPDLPVEKLRFEAERMMPLVRSDLVELGHTHVGRWQHIFDVYRELGLAPGGADIDIRGLIYHPPQPTDLRWLLWVLAAGALVLAVVTWIARRFYRVSWRLRQQLEENRRLQDELLALTIIDPLTGLHNRRHFDIVCATEWERARRDHRSLTVLFIDVDYFKSYNDFHGHRAGDDCLAAVGQAVGQSLQRPADLAARYGGDEFVVLLPDTYTDGALDVARRVVAAIAALGIPHGASPFGRVTSSIGVAQLAPGPNHTFQELLERADRALYAAKEAGRNGVMATPTHLFDQPVAR